MKKHHNLCHFAVNSRFGYTLAYSLCQVIYGLLLAFTAVAAVISMIALTTWGLVSIPWIANFNEWLEKTASWDRLLHPVLYNAGLAMEIIVMISICIFTVAPIFWFIAVSADSEKNARILKPILPLSLVAYFLLWPTLGWGVVAIVILVIAVKTAVHFGFKMPGIIPDYLGESYNHRDENDRMMLLQNPPIWVLPLWIYYQLTIANTARRFKEMFSVASVASSDDFREIQKDIDDELTRRAMKATDTASRRLFWKAHDTARDMGFRAQGKIKHYLSLES